MSICDMEIENAFSFYYTKLIGSYPNRVTFFVLINPCPFNICYLSTVSKSKRTSIKRGEARYRNNNGPILI